VKQIDSRAMADLAHHILLRRLTQSMIWCSVHQEGASATHNARETDISQKSVGRIIHKVIQLKCLKKRLKHGRESCTALLI